MKRQPCQYCAARGGKKHATNCARPLKVTQAVAHPTARLNEPLRNHIALVLDASGSMAHLRQDVQKNIDTQVAEIKKNAARLGQPTSLSIYVFSDGVRRIAFHDNVFDYRSMEYGIPSGQTALFDATGIAINDLSAFPDANNLNTSFLVNVITDGGENASRIFSATTLNALISKVQSSDRWTFVFSVPRNGSHALLRFGIPAGNIQEWEQSSQGVETMTASIVGGFRDYYDGRSRGVLKSANFFAPNMANVSKAAIRALNDMSRDFHTWNVDDPLPKDIEQIRDFVESKLRQQPALAKRVGQYYKLGNGYYQLTKGVEVQANKDIVILDKATNALYGGMDARGLIGCPMHMAFKMKPGVMDNYDIFIKSTSVNRKLIPGTKVLYFLG